MTKAEEKKFLESVGNRLIEQSEPKVRDDCPEGIETITLSATLAHIIGRRLLEIAGGLDGKE